MSKFRDLIVDVQEEIRCGKLSFKTIATTYGITEDLVMMIFEEMVQEEDI